MPSSGSGWKPLSVSAGNLEYSITLPTIQAPQLVSLRGQEAQEGIVPEEVLSVLVYMPLTCE